MNLSKESFEILQEQEKEAHTVLKMCDVKMKMYWEGEVNAFRLIFDLIKTDNDPNLAINEEEEERYLRDLDLENPTGLGLTDEQLSAREEPLYILGQGTSKTIVYPSDV